MLAMRLKPEETLYVGDMEIDVQTARASGLAVIVMPTGSRGEEALRDAGADLVVADFSALLEWLPGPAGGSRHA
jgi:phosphoglycolate phosphatase